MCVYVWNMNTYIDIYVYIYIYIYIYIHINTYIYIHAERGREIKILRLKHDRCEAPLLKDIALWRLGARPGDRVTNDRLVAVYSNRTTFVAQPSLSVEKN